MGIFLALNTKIEDIGYLSKIGDFGMAPCRALWNGRAVTVVDKVVTDVTPKSVMSTALAIALIIPGLLLVIFKLLSLLFSDVREKHELAQAFFAKSSASDRPSDVDGSKDNIGSPADADRVVEVPEAVIKQEVRELLSYMVEWVELRQDDKSNRPKIEVTFRPDGTCNSVRFTQ